MILERDIGLDLIAERGDMRGRQHAAHCRLDIEIAPALAERECRQVGPGIVGQRADSGRRLDLEPHGDEVVVAARRAARQLLLHPHEGPVAETGERALAGRRIAQLVRRRRDLNLVAVAHDQVQALAAVGDPGVGAIAGLLLGAVETEALLEHAGGGDERTAPGRLIGPHLLRPRRPGGEKIRHGVCFGRPGNKRRRRWPGDAGRRQRPIRLRRTRCLPVVSRRRPAGHEQRSIAPPTGKFFIDVVARRIRAA